MFNFGIKIFKINFFKRIYFLLINFVIKFLKKQFKIIKIEEITIHDCWK